MLCDSRLKREAPQPRVNYRYLFVNNIHFTPTGLKNILFRKLALYLPKWHAAFYRPQTKFAKVMFLHLSVSHSVHGGGGCLVLGGLVPGEVPGGDPHPPRMATAAGGTHPTGMLSCLNGISPVCCAFLLPGAR